MSTEFLGQQDGERVLYVVHPHRLIHWVEFGSFVGGSIALLVLFWIISLGGGSMAGVIQLLGILSAAILLFVGWWMVSLSTQKNLTYITDRRVVRFSVTSLWSVEPRSISWDEVVKVKTKSAGMWWRALNIGSVVVHARTDNDDIQVDGVEYYRDLGNYLDKIVYLFKNDHPKLSEIRPFVAKPVGKRY